MPTVFEHEIEANMRAFPGLGRIQAINRIRAAKTLRADHSRRVTATNWMK